MNRDEDLPLSLLARICRLHHTGAWYLFQKAGLYRGQPPMLGLLRARQGRTHTELARALGITPATVTKMVKRMESAGFVERRADPADERVSRVYLTRRGMAVETEVRRSLEQYDRQVLAGFSKEEQRLLDDLLTRVHDNLAQIIARSKDEE